MTPVSVASIIQEFAAKQNKILASMDNQINGLFQSVIDLLGKTPLLSGKNPHLTAKEFQQLTEYNHLLNRSLSLLQRALFEKVIHVKYYYQVLSVGNSYGFTNS